MMQVSNNRKNLINNTMLDGSRTSSNAGKEGNDH